MDTHRFKGIDKLVIASNNEGKIREFRTLLAPFAGKVVLMREAGIDFEVEETGQTFAQNAMLKADAIAKHLGCACLADDSGLCVDALGGAPGVYSARYGGEGLDDAGRTKKLLDAMAGVPEGERGARFVCHIVLVLPEGDALAVEADCPGTIAFAPSGSGGFGYDPVFLYEGTSFAELPADEKNRISHRARALQMLMKALEARYAVSDPE